MTETFGVKSIPPCGDCDEDGQCTMNCGPPADGPTPPAMRRAQEAYRRQLPKKLTLVPGEELAALNAGRAVPPFAAWRSRYYLVQAYREGHGVVRLSICRAQQRRGRWRDGISWDRLQAIKSEIGYGDKDALEIYPRDDDVVDVANMRHLWVMPAPISFAWRKRRD